MLLGKPQGMRVLCILTLFWMMGTGVYAQKVKVPSTIYFADMRLDLSSAAQKKIQTDVDALLRSEKYFQLKMDKIDAYFPLIEQVLKEENVPDDIKYLVIQESALVGNAVSTSNAIGYWQFKEPSAREVGLTINRDVDERMNIINATRGAAKYFKSNNTYFNNWLYALMAYMTGPGGALKIADKRNHNQKYMRLAGDTHWYVLKFLAHKIAYEPYIGKNSHPKVQLFTYNKGKGKTLEEIAKEFDLQEKDLEPYNYWLKAKHVPDDKPYYVIIPDFSGDINEELLVQADETETIQERADNTQASVQTDTHALDIPETKGFPVMEKFNKRGAEIKINGIPGVVAREGEDIRSISRRAEITPSKFVLYNDLTSKNSDIVPGEAYYIRNKRNRGAAHYHIVQPGESLWSISQRFSLKIKKLMRDNRMREEQVLKPGRVLWMRFIRPESFPVEYRDVPNAPAQTVPFVETASSQSTTTQASPAEPQNNTSAESIPASQEDLWEEADNPSEPATDTDREYATTNSYEKQEKSGEKEIQAAEELTDSSDYNQESYDSWESPAPTTEQEPLEESTSPTKSALPKESDNSQVFKSSNVVFTDTDQGIEAPPTLYTVQSGDTYYSISRRYQIPIEEIKKLNKLSDGVPLKSGQQLKLKVTEQKQNTTAPSPSPNEYIYHHVKSGETLYAVAREYNVTIKDIMKWNDKDTFDVSIGEKLKIARK